MANEKLVDFLRQLVTELDQYLADPDGYIDGSELSQAHKTLLKRGRLNEIQAAVRREEPGAIAMRIFAIS